MSGGRRMAEGGRRMALARSGGMRRALGPVLVAAALFFPAAAPAQRITVDPTRPPPGFGTGADDAERETGGGVRLQTVKISPTQRAAIINGVMVRLGEKYGDAVLVKVAENEVVLKGAGAQQVLRIHPEVDMRARVTKP